MRVLGTVMLDLLQGAPRRSGVVGPDQRDQQDQRDHHQWWDVLPPMEETWMFSRALF